MALSGLIILPRMPYPSSQNNDVICIYKMLRHTRGSGVSNVHTHSLTERLEVMETHRCILMPVHWVAPGWSCVVSAAASETSWGYVIPNFSFFFPLSVYLFFSISRGGSRSV